MNKNMHYSRLEDDKNYQYSVSLNNALESAKTQKEKLDILNDSHENIINKYNPLPKKSLNGFSKVLQTLENCLEE